MSNAPHKDALTAEQFCKIYTSFYGEVIDHIGQLRQHNFTGEELLEFVGFALQQSKGNDLEPGVQPPDSASLASHSCTDGNSIEQETADMLTLAEDIQKNIHREIELVKNLSPNLQHQDVFNSCIICRLAKLEYMIKQLKPLLNSGPNPEVSDTTDDDSSTGGEK
jgi:hypothetical protein